MKDDTISRQAALDALNMADDKGQIHSILDVNDVIKSLPPAQPTGTNTVQVDDCISRAAAINAICEDGTRIERQGRYSMTMVERKQRDVDILENMPSAQQWIPCSDALPSEYDTYLITTEDGMVVFGVYDPKEEQWSRYDSIKSCWLYGIKALAWMPLPEPWEGGQDE